MFGQINLKKARKTIINVLRKAGLRCKTETEAKRVIGSVYAVTIDRENCSVFMIIVYRDGSCFISACYGHMEKTEINLLALQNFNSKSLGWRAYINDEGDLNFDLDCFNVNPSKLKRFLRSNFDGFIDGDTEKYYHQLCQACTK